MCHTEYLINQLFLGQVGNELSGDGRGWGGHGQRLLEFSQGRESVFPLERNKLWKVLQKSALPYFMSLDTFQCLLVYSL